MLICKSRRSYVHEVNSSTMRILVHDNILSNIQALKLRGNVRQGETIIGVVPFFHSFGFTMTLWAPLCLGETVVYHYDPFDAKRISDLCQKFSATMLVCTPTMLSYYLRRCSARSFSSVNSFIVGGEKLKPAQFREIEERLQSVPLEGYGLAETAPVISCNVQGQVRLPDGRIVAGTTGEMVPHLAVEEMISRLAGCNDQTVCVTSRSDDRRGEAFVVVYSDLNGLPPAEVVSRLKKSDVCRLWIPGIDDFIRVSEMPHLRNGKMDLRCIREIARTRGREVASLSSQLKHSV